MHGAAPAAAILPPGARRSLQHRMVAADLAPIAAMLGEANPRLAVRAAGTLMTRMIFTRFPGPGTTILREDYRYAGSLAEGDEVTVTAEVIGGGGNDSSGEEGALRLACMVRLRGGSPLLEGEALVLPPPAGTPAPPAATEDEFFGARPARLISRLLARCRDLAPLPTAVVHPVDEESLRGAMLAAAQGLILPILVGPEARIRGAAAAAGIDLSGAEVIHAPHSHAAAEIAVKLVAEGRAGGLMKGSLHTDEIMGAALARSAGLRTERRVSHCFVMDAPLYPRPLIITDAAINIAPDLEAKADIVRNAVTMANAIGIELPRVALLSAVETVTPRIASTLEAAALCKMADRGQIRGAILDGPLAFDNAVSEAAARAKGIVSGVAGRADVLVCPDLESGNMLAKQLSYLGGAESAGLVLGLRCPVALTSRADDANARLASAALMRLVAAG